MLFNSGVPFVSDAVLYPLIHPPAWHAPPLHMSYRARWLEYAILSIAAFSTAAHLVLHVMDSRMEGAWHAKATWIMLLEFFSEV